MWDVGNVLGWIIDEVNRKIDGISVGFFMLVSAWFHGLCGMSVQFNLMLHAVIFIWCVFEHIMHDIYIDRSRSRCHVEANRQYLDDLTPSYQGARSLL